MTSSSLFSIQSCADAAGFPISAATSGFFPLAGDIQFSTTESNVQTRIPTSLTLQSLLVFAWQNSTNGSTTLNSRKNGANGSLAVSIPASTTGTFQDTTDVDSFSSGDFMDTFFSAGGTTGATTVTIVSYITVESSGPQVILMMDLSFKVGGAVTNFIPLNGAGTNATETNVQYTVQYAGSWSLLDVIVTANTLTGASTATSRKNALAGTQSVSIGAGLTGEFVDTTHTDSFVAGDKLDYQFVSGAGTGTKSITLSKIQSVISATSSQQYPLFLGDGRTVSFVGGTNTFLAPAGGLAQNTDEAASKLMVRPSSATASNLFVLCTSNTTNGATTFSSRKNGAAGALSVSIPAATSGTFVDNTHTDTYSSGDFIDYQMNNSAASTGSIAFSIAAIVLTSGILLPVLLKMRGDGFVWSVSH